MIEFALVAQAIAGHYLGQPELQGGRMTGAHSILLEVAAASVEDTRAAEAGGAARVELNSALALGGLTPSLGLLQEVKQCTKLPVLAMVRPRPGGFAYSEAEYRVLRRDVDVLLANGADGIVFGILTPDGRIDRERCRQVVRQASEKPCVFHRAFDVTPQPFEALELLIDLGFCRVMTSGLEVRAEQGIPLIAELIQRAAGRIEVLPAGGINRDTVRQIVSGTGCNQIHAGLRELREDRSVSGRPQMSFRSAPPASDGYYEAVRAEAVLELMDQLRKP